MIKNKYEFDALLDYTRKVFKKYLDTSVAGTEEERKKEALRKDTLRQSAEDCFAGGLKERQFVKQFIQRILTNDMGNTFLDEFGEMDIHVTAENYKDVYPWDEPYKLPTHIKYLGLLYFWRKQHGASAFEYLLTKYNLDKLRPLVTFQSDELVVDGFYVNAQDIDAMFSGERIVFTYELAIEVLVQLIYEEFKGNSCIDELMYQNVDDIGVGLSGLQSDIEPTFLKGKKMIKSYDGAWVMHKGALINLSFLSFHSFANLKRVVRQIVLYKQIGSFSQKDGYKSGYGKDGSRRTAAIEPFSQNDVAWVRKFTAKTYTNRMLISYRDGEPVKNIQTLMKVEKALVQGGATIPICGPMGAGKTTKLEGIIEYVQNWYGIRMIESEFEARLNLRYPEKNIVALQTSTIDAEKAYEFSLRTSGAIYVVSEARSDEMMVNIVRTASRGGRSVMFTYHPNKPRATMVEIANSLVRQKLYTSLKDAMYTALDAVKCCIFIEPDMEHKSRYYNIYEFVPVQLKINDDFLSKTGNDRTEAFMLTLYDYYKHNIEDEYFTVRPIITYDRHENSYIFNNTITDRFYEDLVRNSTIDKEKDSLEKLFRPTTYLLRYVKQNNLTDLTVDKIDALIAQEDLTQEFVDYDKVIEGGVC